MCKVNNAAFVRRILPQTCLSECLMDDLALWMPSNKPTVSLRRTKGSLH